MADIDLLLRVLRLEHISDKQRADFESMRDELRRRDGRRFAKREPHKYVEARLTDAQRAYITGVLERHGDGAETSLNLVSSGKVPRGREVEVPTVLRNLPRKPPGMGAR